LPQVFIIAGFSCCKACSHMSLSHHYYNYKCFKKVIKKVDGIENEDGLLCTKSMLQPAGSIPAQWVSCPSSRKISRVLSKRQDSVG